MLGLALMKKPPVVVWEGVHAETGKRLRVLVNPHLYWVEAYESRGWADIDMTKDLERYAVRAALEQACPKASAKAFREAAEFVESCKPPASMMGASVIRESLQLMVDEFNERARRAEIPPE